MSGVKDIVRAMAIVGQMVHVAQLLRLLRQMQAEGLIIVIRFKERFLRTPSGCVRVLSRDANPSSEYRCATSTFTITSPTIMHQFLISYQYTTHTPQYLSTTAQRYT